LGTLKFTYPAGDELTAAFISDSSRLLAVAQPFGSSNGMAPSNLRGDRVMKNLNYRRALSLRLREELRRAFQQ
jgi:hypothetical protein